jgi:hypothetical protein
MLSFIYLRRVRTTTTLTQSEECDTCSMRFILPVDVLVVVMVVVVVVVLLLLRLFCKTIVDSRDRERVRAW